MRKSIVLFVIVVLTAGCLGSPDADGDPADADVPGDEDPPGTQWETVDRSGTVTGAGTPVVSVSQADGNTATWTVPEDARVMYLNVTTEGGELSIQYGDACETEDTVQCEHQTMTEDGEMREIVQQPASGGWEMYFFLENNVGEVDWELVVDMGVVS